MKSRLAVSTRASQELYPDVMPLGACKSRDHEISPPRWWAILAIKPPKMKEHLEEQEYIQPSLCITYPCIASRSIEILQTATVPRNNATRRSHHTLFSADRHGVLLSLDSLARPPSSRSSLSMRPNAFSTSLSQLLNATMAHSRSPTR